MRVERIRIRSLASLRGPQTAIDLAGPALGEAGLIAITGPTGSGKSTVLDALCLALYGRTPRLDRQAGELLSRDATEGSAEVDLRLDDGSCWTAAWQLRRMRSGELSRPSMQVRDAQGSVVVEGVLAVAAWVTQRLGLSFDQFRGVVMLPQFEFARFLSGDDNDRSALLEKLTGTGIYARISREAFVRHQRATTTVALHAERIRAISVLSETERSTLAERLASIDQAMAGATRRRDQALAAMAWWRERQRLEAELAAADQLLGEAQRAQDLAEGDAVRLTLAEAAEGYAAALALLDRAEGESARLVLAQPQAEALHHAAATRLAQATTALLAAWYALLSAAEAAVHLAAVDHACAELDATALLPSQDAAREARAMAGEIQRRHADMSEAEKRLRACAGESLAAVDSDALPAALAAITSTAGHAAATASAEAAVARARRDLAVAQARAAELRGVLRAGEPCPLCGSLEHPGAGHSVVGGVAATESALAEAERRERRARDTEALSARAAAAAAEAMVALQAARQRLDVARQAQLTAQDAARMAIADLAARLGETRPQQAATWLDALPGRIAMATTRRQQAFGLTAAVEELRPFIPSGSSAAAVPVGDPIAPVRQFLRRFVDEHAACDRTDAERMRLRSASTEALHQTTTRHDELIAALTGSPFKDLAGLRAARMPGDERLHLAGRLRLAQQQLAVASGSRLTAGDRYANQAACPLPQIDFAATLAETTAAEEGLARLHHAFGADRGARERDDAQRQRLAELQREAVPLQEAAAQSAALYELIGHKEGASFRRFAQALTLDQLLQLANLRLQSLAPRYALVRVPVAVGEQVSLDLDVIDHDQADERRSVATLSGGETFLVSLALALALADLQGGGIRLGTLFIDEGFGSLDPAALERCLAILERLQQEQGTQIVVISHVGALHERLAHRIEVHPSGGGRSRLRVVWPEGSSESTSEPEPPPPRRRTRGAAKAD